MLLTTDLVAQIRRMGQLPDTSTAALSTADILAHCDMEIQSVLLPEVRLVQQDFLVQKTDVVSADSFVPLPRRAATGAVRLVQLVLSGNILVPLSRMDPAQDRGAGTAAGLPAGFCFDGGGIRLVPSGSSCTVRIWYYVTPPKLILDTATTRTSRILTLSNTSPTWTFTTGGTLMTGSTFDFIGGSGTLNDVYAEQVSLSSGTIASGTVAQSALAHPPRVNDWVVGYASPALSFEPPASPLFPLPDEMAPVCVARVAARVLMGLGYVAEADAQWRAADNALLSARRLLVPRSDGNPKVLTGGLRSAIRGPWWGDYDWRW